MQKKRSFFGLRCALCLVICFKFLNFVSLADKSEKERSKRQLILKLPPSLSLSSPQVFLFKQQTLPRGNRAFVPYLRPDPARSLPLNPGRYLLTTECGGIEFEHGTEKDTQLALTLLRFTDGPMAKRTDILSLKNQESAPDTPFFPVTCADALDGSKSTWQNRFEFLVPASSVKMNISGQEVMFRLTPDQGGAVVELPLARLQVNAPSQLVRSELSFFVSAVEDTDEKKSERPLGVAEASGFKGLPSFVERMLPADINHASVVPVPLASVILLLPGRYRIEINGTRKDVVLASHELTELRSGILRIQTPEGFPMAERLRKGGQPIFAFINGGVLFHLDNNYVVFPGQYSVSLEGSDVKGIFLVKSDEQTIVSTRGMKISLPDKCKNQGSCSPVPQLTVHKNKKPFVLKHADMDVPFLLFDENFEYGIEGARGLYRDIPEVPYFQETLARLLLRWELRPATHHQRTDLVRLEAKSKAVTGKSLDLLYSRPEAMFVPPGDYELSYFVGDPAALERPKTRVSLHLQPGEVRELVIPVYSDRFKPDEVSHAAAASGGGQPGQKEALADQDDLGPGSKGNETPTLQPLQ